MTALELCYYLPAAMQIWRFRQVGFSGARHHPKTRAGWSSAADIIASDVDDDDDVDAADIDEDGEVDQKHGIVTVWYCDCVVL